MQAHELRVKGREGDRSVYKEREGYGKGTLVRGLVVMRGGKVRVEGVRQKQVYHKISIGLPSRM